ncbi:MAG TPA: hypothetical protein VLB44_05355 [Kofleriaceae bacterium]|nr:hypothetical protein [Kofleriaceae bacterium]
MSVMEIFQPILDPLESFVAKIGPDARAIKFRGQYEVADRVIDVLGPVLPQLTYLDLTGMPIGSAGLRRLLMDPRAAKLHTLILGGVMYQEVSKPGPWPDEVLDPKWKAMLTTRLGDEGLHELGMVYELRGLRSLDVSHVVARPESWRAFATSPLAAQLECLTVDMADLETETIEALLGHARELRSLAIQAKDGDAAAAVIARHGAQLRRLCLHYVHNSGIKTLLDASLPELRTLEVLGTFDGETIEVIRRRQGLPALSTLYLPYDSQIPTGKEEVWTDWDGSVVGGGVEYMKIWEVEKQFFADSTLRIGHSPPWPTTWL